MPGPRIKLSGFSGEQPRVVARLLPENAAQSALNVRLDDGALTPMRQSLIVDEVASVDARTIYRHGDTWLEWDAEVYAAPGPVADDRLYFTGNGAPKMRAGGTIYPLALPLPNPALAGTATGVGAGDVTSRVYVWTWVTSFGEESEPSPPSNEVEWQPGQTVTLTGFPAAPAGRAITLQRIYRSQTGQAGTYLYLIAERAASAADFVDTVAVDAFQEPLPSANWNAPPDDLDGLIAVPNGIMAGFVGRKLYFCEPYRPHAWPEKYVVTVDSDIVGLGAIGTSIVVATKAQPYLVSGTSPETMQSEKIEQNLPCINGRALADLGYAIAYPSHDGLVVVKSDGSIGIATGNIFSPETWKQMSPQTMVAGQIYGRYVAFYDTLDPLGRPLAGALLIDLAGTSFLIRTDARAQAAFYDVADGALYYLATGTNDIMRMDAPTASRQKLYWRSKEFVLPYPENFGAILVDASSALSDQEQLNLEALIASIIETNTALLDAGPIEGAVDGAALDVHAVDGDVLTPAPLTGAKVVVSIYADGILRGAISAPNRAKRLPSGFKARTWVIDVFGDLQVQQIVMAKSMDDLKTQP